MKKIIALFIILSCSLFVGCKKTNEVSKNKTMDEVVVEIKEEECKGSFSEIIYASRDRVIIAGDIGLIIYDLKNKEIYRAINTRSIEMHYMQGELTTVFKTKKDGSEVLMYNFPGGEVAYLYNIEEDKLIKEKLKDIDEAEYTFDYAARNEIDMDTSRKYSGKYKDSHYTCTYANVDESTISYLIMPRNKKEEVKSPLQIIMFNKEANEEKVYNVF